MQYKTRRYCPRCKIWVPRNSEEWCGLHKCLCGRKFHSVDVLKNHLALIHYYDYQQISKFLHQNPKSKNGNINTSTQSKVRSGWFNNVFCMGCSNYLVNNQDQCRFCRRIKCTHNGSCSFFAHSQDHLKDHLREVHAVMPFQEAGDKFADQWCDTIWSKNQYFLCHLCDGFITYPDGEKELNINCCGYICPISACDGSIKQKPYHNIEHLLYHMKQIHQYWQCEVCSKYLPPNIKTKCQRVFCEKCQLLHHNNGEFDECNVTLNTLDMKPICV